MTGEGQSGHWLRQVTRYQWLVMLVAGGAWMFDNVDQRLFSLARIPALADLMHAASSDVTVQAFGKTVTAVFLVGWGLGGIVFGTFGDRFGQVRVLSLSILLYALGTAATAMSPDEHVFLVLRFVTGFGIGGVFGLAAAIIAESFEGAARVGMLALLQILSTIGNIGAALIKMAVDQGASAGMIAPESSWRILFALGGLPIVLAAVGIVSLREPESWTRARGQNYVPVGIFGPYRALLGNRTERRNLIVGAMLAGAGVIGLWGVGEYAVDLQDTVFRSYYRGHGGEANVAALTASAKNLAYLLQMIGAAVGMFCFAAAANRFGRRPAFAVAYALAFAMTVFTYGYLKTPMDAYWMVPLMGAAQFSVFVGFSLYLPELFSTGVRATGISFCYNIGRFAAAAGSLVSAALSTRLYGGFPSPLPLRYSAITMSVVFLVGIVAALLGPETGGRKFRMATEGRMTIRIGIAGAGFAAQFHLDCYARVYGEDFAIAAICGGKIERAAALADRFAIPVRHDSFDALVTDPTIDAVDICVPAHLHVPFILKAAAHDKHIICEKPLGGYFGPPGADDEWLAHDASREAMLDHVITQAREVRAAIAKAGVTFCYGENWVYAPPIVKVDRLMAASGSAILRIEGEESHSGSHATYSRRWRRAGGGALARLCVHPIGGALHLKRQEGLRRNGTPIRPVAVSAQVANLTHMPSFASEDRLHIATGWVDVEDFASVHITFEDGSVAQCTSTDTRLGGIRNTLTAHGSRALAIANINPSDAVTAYTPDGSYFTDEYIVEKTETKQGWSHPAPDEEGITGYPGELRDFVGAIARGRAPVSDLDLAIEVMLLVYAGYLSAARAARVDLVDYRARMQA